MMQHQKTSSHWEKESTHRPVPLSLKKELFFAEKDNGGHRKDFDGRYGFPGFS